MVAPMAKLLIRLVSVIMIWEPVDTADTSTAWANLPTIIKSTAPYIACRNSARKTGAMNRRSGDRIFPSVKLISFCIVCLPQKKTG